MTKFIASNSVTRRYLKRGELMAKRRAEAGQNEARKTECMSRVERATSLGSLRIKPTQEESAGRGSREYYKDSNPYGNKIHAVQKIKLYSKPPVGVF